MNADLETNRRAWDAVVAAHAASAFYDVDGFLAGACTLDPLEVEQVGPVEGLRLVHLQCHFGLDTLSWARRGARVAGLDFSPKAIETARAVALRAGLEADFHCGDACDPPARWQGAFDLVCTGGGALCWLPDLDAWAATVRRLLVPGGRLQLRDFHPFATMLDEKMADGRVELRYPYFRAAGAMRFDDGLQYAAATAGQATVEWAHALSEVVQALLDAGLAIEALREHAECSYRSHDFLEQGEDGRWRLPGLPGGLPLMFSLSARRPA